MFIVVLLTIYMQLSRMQLIIVHYILHFYLKVPSGSQVSLPALPLPLLVSTSHQVSFTSFNEEHI